MSLEATILEPVIYVNINEDENITITINEEKIYVNIISDEALKLFNSLGNSTDGSVNQNALTRAIQDSSAISGTATGTDTYVVSLTPALSAYAAGQIFEIKFTNANTGPATINVNGLGVKSIKKNVSSSLIANDIKSGQILSLAYDGTNFQIIGGSVAQASNTQAGVTKLYNSLGTNTDGTVDQYTLLIATVGARVYLFNNY